MSFHSKLNTESERAVFCVSVSLNKMIFVLTNNEYNCINDSNNCEIERHGHVSVVRLNHNLKYVET